MKKIWNIIKKVLHIDKTVIRDGVDDLLGELETLVETGKDEVDDMLDDMLGAGSNHDKVEAALDETFGNDYIAYDTLRDALTEAVDTGDTRRAEQLRDLYTIETEEEFVETVKAIFGV